MPHCMRMNNYGSIRLMNKNGDPLTTLKTQELNDSYSNRILQELVCIQERDNECSLAQFESLVSANQYRLLYRIARKYVPIGIRVLDWGCGNGHFSYALLRLGYKAYGFELGDFPLRKYLSKDYEFTQADPMNPNVLPYPNDNFDAVFSVGVLEHVREDTRGTEEVSLREIFRVLKPGGYFICYHFPNLLSWIEGLTAVLPHKHHHSYRYTKRSIKELCQRTGYELQEMRRYGALPRNLWNSIPQRISRSQLVTDAWNTTDQIMSYPLSPFCQNYLFVAKKSLASSH